MLRFKQTNSTVSGNSTAGDDADGGGFSVGNGSVTVIGSTITDNHATGRNSSGGGLFQSEFANRPVNITGSIIAGNTATTSGLDFKPDSDGSTITVTKSLIGNYSGTTLDPAPVGSPDASGNLIGMPGSLIDPLLGPLTDNSGPTFTHLPQANSSAVDAVTFRGTATQSTEFNLSVFGADKAIDGDPVTFSHTAVSDDMADWPLDVGGPTVIDEVVLINRPSLQSRLRDITVEILDAADAVLFSSELLNPENVRGDRQLANGPASLSVDLTTRVLGHKIRVSRTADRVTRSSAVCDWERMSITKKTRHRMTEPTATISTEHYRTTKTVC